jgi:hypothetical protein
MWSPHELAAYSDVVLIGRIEALEPAWDSETAAIYTHVRVTVERVLKGTVPHAQIVVKQLGGRVGGVGLHVHDQADFHVGETALLFLEVRPRDGTLYTSALWQGKWTVGVDRAGRRVATRQDPEHLQVGLGERHTLSALERAIADAAGGSTGGMAIEFLPLGRQLAPASEYMASTHSFTLLGPLRYLFSPAVDMQAGGQPGLPGGGVAEVLAAINKWNNAGSSFRYRPGSTNGPSRCTTDELDNGRVTITFMDPCEEMSNTGGTLAIGGSYYFFGGGGNVDGREFHRASEGFIVLNDGDVALRYLTQPPCFEDVQTHELGHVLGLGHSVDPNAIMFPTINAGCGTGPRPLGADDIAGITYIYGFRAIGQTSALTQVAPEVSVAVNGVESVTVTWLMSNPLTTGQAAAVPWYRVDFGRGHVDGAPALASFTTSANVLTVGIPSGTTGDFHVVVTPLDPSGAGPSSRRTDFSICDALPGPVIGLRAEVGGGVARVSWLPAANASAYRASVGSSPGAADLVPATELGSGTSVQAPVAPTFRGWLRVLAVNACGSGPPADVLVSGQ